jgi:hypothetical protein
MPSLHYYRKLWNEQDSKGEEGTEEERSSEVTEDNEDRITIPPQAPSLLLVNLVLFIAMCGIL